MIRNETSFVECLTTQTKQEMLKAVESDDPEQIGALLKSGLDINADLSDGDSALHIAAATGSVKACSCLLLHKADVNLPDRKNGYTALHYAVGEGQRSVVQLLISHGANAAQEDFHGQVPAAWAQSDSLRNMVNVQVPKDAFDKAQGDHDIHQNTEADKFGQQEAARRRIERRIAQIVDSEDELLYTFSMLKDALSSLKAEGERQYTELEKILALEIEDIIQVLKNVHTSIRERTADSLHDSLSLFQPPILFNNGTVGQLIQWHSYYEEASTNLLMSLRFRMSQSNNETSCANQMRLCEQLLPKPTHQISRYLLFFEEMLADAMLLSHPPTLEAVKHILQIVKAMIHEIRERKRDRESKEQVVELSKKVLDVPSGTRISVSGRRLRLRQSSLWQIVDSQTKRKVEVFLFNDAMMVCLKKPNGDGVIDDNSLLCFADMLNLQGFTTASCPTVEMLAPDRHPALLPREQGIPKPRSPSAKSPNDEDQNYCLSVSGRLFVGGHYSLTQLADAIAAAVMEIRKPPCPVGLPEGVGPVGISRDADGNTTVMYFF